MRCGWFWLLCALLGWVGGARALELTPAEAAGKRLYLQGIGSNASVVYARVGAAGSLLPASALPCAGCHGRDGRGRAEGGVRPPDITWRRLTMPHGSRPDRPPYDARSLARALRAGLDPAGKRLDPAMPRFVMSPRDLANLVAYLRRLEDDRDPGLHERVVRLGTLLPGSGPLAPLGRRIEALLEGAFAAINEAGGIHGRRLELVVADPGGDLASAEAALAGLLDGGDVFALLAPFAPLLEEHYPRLLEPAGVPLVGPLVQLAAARSPLLFEPLPGPREQLFALADYARGELPEGPGETLIVHPDEARQQALAAALQRHLQASGWTRVRLLGYSPGALAGLPPSDGVKALFWLGNAQALVELSGALAAAQSRPWVFAAAGQVSGGALDLAPAFAGRLLLAYPFLPSDWTATGAEALQTLRRRSGLDPRHTVLQVGAYSAALVLAEGLGRAGRDASRERLVNALENLHAFHTGLTPPLGFGPGQRVGAPGAHIVAVDLAQRRFRPTGRYQRLEAP
ncbi:ABC transporter substrate-binding protein [Pseudomonas stutzeri]|nr:ABC transporter substrate-binding protein [Stutzerimonas stutzeri]